MRIMLRSHVTSGLVLGVVALVASAVVSAQMKVTTTPKPEPDPRIVQLEQRVRDLEARVKALEDEGDFLGDEKEGGGATKPKGRDTGSSTAGRGGEPGGTSAGAGVRPTRVKAPFEVVDDAGKVILRIERGPAGGGVVQALTVNGGLAAQLGVGSTGFAGSVRLNKDGKELAVMGIAGDEGVIRLRDPVGRNRLQLGAELDGGGLAMYDTSGKERVRLGFLDGGRGYVAVRNTAGIEVGNLFESAAGVGSLMTRDADGQGVQIGTKSRSSGAFGDVCATSPKGGMCLSVLAIKTMNPY